MSMPTPACTIPSALGEHFLGSDSVINTYGPWRSMRQPVGIPCRLGTQPCACRAARMCALIAASAHSPSLTRAASTSSAWWPMLRPSAASL